MKRIISLLIFFLTGTAILANPIPLPMIEISELYFDESDNWKLELAYYYIEPNETVIDSIMLYSTSDTVKLPAYEFINIEGVLVITNDSLSEDFVIKRFADTIKIVTYMYQEPFEDELIYGNCENAFIDCPREGQSISRYAIYFVKDNSPTIGSPNDTCGMCGTLQGIIYDIHNEPVKNCKFILDNYFTTSMDGEFVTRVLAKPTSFNRIYYSIAQYENRSVPVTEISYIMEPDSLINHDINLLDTLESGYKDYVFNEDLIRIFPVPVKANDQLNVNIDLPVLSSDIWLEIFDMSGKLIRKEKIFRQQNLVDTPGKEGVYILTIRLENQVISSNKILVE